MLRLLMAGTVTLALLGGLSGAAVAQMDTDADVVYTTYVTTEHASFDLGSVTGTEALYSARDGVSVHTNEWTDPRVSGTWTIAFNVDQDPATGHGIQWGTARIENDGGTWEGPFTGMEYKPGETDYLMNAGWMTGDGDYAGYTFYWEVDAEQHGSADPRTWHGVIYRGDPPPLLE